MKPKFKKGDVLIHRCHTLILIKIDLIVKETYEYSVVTPTNYDIRRVSNTDVIERCYEKLDGNGKVPKMLGTIYA